MKLEEIEKYLSNKNTKIDSDVANEIEKHRKTAIQDSNEDKANHCWCLAQILKIQVNYVSAVQYLKNKEYEKAWLDFDLADTNISLLENNFDISIDDDKYHMQVILRMIKEYQKLFPYHYFTSRECFIKSERCSICGKPITFRKSCGHKIGKLYMGEICLREVTELEFKAFAIVKDPYDKYAYIKINDMEYNYDNLDELMTYVSSPYDEFRVDKVKIKKPEYKNIGRNDKCPCGSGKKYKKCHLGSKDELMDHYKVTIKK